MKTIGESPCTRCGSTEYYESITTPDGCVRCRECAEELKLMDITDKIEEMIRIVKNELESRRRGREQS